MEIKIIQRRDLIRGVARKWNFHYRNTSDGGKVEIGRNLQALDLETCSPQDVDAIIGNSTWTENDCDGCKRDLPMLIHIGPEPDYEVRYLRLCLECLTIARTALAAVEPLP